MRGGSCCRKQRSPAAQWFRSRSCLMRVGRGGRIARGLSRLRLAVVHGCAFVEAKGLAVRVVACGPERAERIFGEPRPELSYQAGDLLDDRSAAAAIEGAYMVVNAVSLYAERDGITFEAVHVKGARRVARLSARHGAERLVQISGIGADTRSQSRYIRTRGEGERAVRDEFSGAVVVRPAVMCGPGDAFL